MLRLPAKGEPILPVAATGVVRDVDTAETGCVLYGSVLSVELVRRALAVGAAAVLTRGGNFACHGANLLRAARASGNSIGWVRGVAADLGATIEVLASGECVGAGVRVARDAPQPALYEFAKDSNSWSKICIWSDRRYSEEEFLLQKFGLEDCMGELVNRPIVVTHGLDERIWFSAPSLNNKQLQDYAEDVTLRRAYLTRMISDYEDLLAEVRQSPHHQRDVQRLATAFFGSLLPFHRSYGAAIKAEAELLGEARVDAAMGIALRGPIVDWLMRQPAFLTSAKQLEDAKWCGLVPDCTVKAAIEEAAHQIACELDDPLADPEQVRWLASIVTVKEFKMILAKNLFALWGRALR